MGDNNVASIGKMLMQTQSGQSVTGVDGADIGTTFRKMVDQMTQIPGSSVSTGSQTAQNMQQLTPHSPEQNYDRYQYQKNKIPEQSTKDWAAGSQVSEKLESFEESVRDVIKDDIGTDRGRSDESAAACSSGGRINRNRRHERTSL